MLNIDLWRSAHGPSATCVYASYQELAGIRASTDARGHVDEVNKSRAEEPLMAASQIKRFLVLHKELEAEDGELTRTMKVRPA